MDHRKHNRHVKHLLYGVPCESRFLGSCSHLATTLHVKYICSEEHINTKRPRHYNSTCLFCSSIESPSNCAMAAALTSFLLLLVAASSSHVSGYTLLPVHCPLMCYCTGNYSHADVVCKNSHLTYIPHYPAGTWRISIENNNIKRLRNKSFLGLYKLTTLRIEDNNVQSIDESAFVGSTALEALTIKEDSLSLFENGAFHFLSNLTELTMHAKLIEIPQRDVCMLRNLKSLILGKFKFSSAIFLRCFKKINKLTTLQLMSIELKKISRATFSPFRRLPLTVLRLINCGLRRLSVDIFEDISRLKELDLSQNAIASLPNDIFVPLTKLHQLNLSGNKLKVVSDKLLQPLRYLGNMYIGGNRDMNVMFGEEFLNMTQLKRLMLNGNKLMSLNNDTFRHLRHSPLNMVDMSSCSIRTISKGSFRPLRNIITLHLGTNPINASVLHDAFYGLQGSPLHNLSISRVHLRDYSTTLFEGLNDNKITHLTLKDCHITTIKRGVFHNLSNVTVLDLSYNGIKSIEEHSFQDLPRLSVLYLGKNNLVEMSSAAQLGISPGLSRLHLESNSIKVILQDALLGYDNLTLLSLFDNSIRTISETAFAPTPHLKVLSVSANKISHIRSGTFDTLPNLQVLSLQHNDITTEDPSLFQVCVVYC